jgi:hypothetical protein
MVQDQRMRNARGGGDILSLSPSGPVLVISA